MNEYRICWYDRYFQSDRVFEFAGKRFRCYADDLAAQRFLERLELDRLTVRHDDGTLAERPRLIRYRRDFDKLAADQPIAGLVLCLIHGSEESRRIALWLLGRSGNSKVIPILRLFASHSRRRLRLAAVHALRRLRARAELVEIAAYDADPVIRQLAGSATQRTFASHLQRFVNDDLSGVPRVSEREPQPLLWNVSDSAGRPPKSTEIIRTILERLRNLLRGNGAHAAPPP